MLVRSSRYWGGAKCPSPAAGIPVGSALCAITATSQFRTVLHEPAGLPNCGERRKPRQPGRRGTRKLNPGKGLGLRQAISLRRVDVPAAPGCVGAAAIRPGTAGPCHGLGLRRRHRGGARTRHGPVVAGRPLGDRPSGIDGNRQYRGRGRVPRSTGGDPDAHRRGGTGKLRPGTRRT